MIHNVLIVAGPFLALLIVAIVAGLTWLSLWLIERGGFRCVVGWLIVITVLAQLVPIVWWPL